MIGNIDIICLDKNQVDVSQCSVIQFRQHSVTVYYFRKIDVVSSIKEAIYSETGLCPIYGFCS